MNKVCGLLTSLNSKNYWHSRNSRSIMIRSNASKQQVRKGPPIKELEKYWHFLNNVEQRVLQGKAGVRQVYDEMADLSADGEHLPFRDESFGSLISTLTFDHFRNCESAAHEFCRVLKDSGLCVLTTFNPYTLKDLKSVFLFMKRLAPTFCGDFVHFCVLIPPLPKTSQTTFKGIR